MPIDAKYQEWKEAVINRLPVPDQTALTKREGLIFEIIYNQSAEIEQEIYDRNMRQAIGEAGGCSVCGDLDGYSCMCEDEEDEHYGWTCDYCGTEIGLHEVEANDHHCNSCMKRF